MNNSNIFDYTQLAEASYASFWDPKTNSLRTDVTYIKKVLAGDDESKGSGFSKTQAQQLTDHWSVLAQYRDRTEGDESSFSATLFQSKGTGEYVFACKGTAEFSGDECA